MKETNLRSIIKAIIFRIVASTATFTLGYIFTGEISAALSIGILDFIIKLSLYYSNERIWNVIKWGKYE